MLSTVLVIIAIVCASLGLTGRFPWTSVATFVLAIILGIQILK